MTLRDRHESSPPPRPSSLSTRSRTRSLLLSRVWSRLTTSVSGLVPLALLAGASACFWLSREGLRAVLALVLGVLALEGFALAVADARAVGVRGDDWTGFALAPAGLALVALGLALLWRSRKHGGRRLLRRGLIAAAAVLGVYWVLVPVAIALMATHRPREAARDGRARTRSRSHSRFGLRMDSTFTAGM